MLQETLAGWVNKADKAGFELSSGAEFAARIRCPAFTDKKVLFIHHLASLASCVPDFRCSQDRKSIATSNTAF